METEEELDRELAELEKRGYRVRYLDPHADDPLDDHYLPVLERPGVSVDKAPELMGKMKKIAAIRHWADLVIVGPDLEPVGSVGSQLGGNSQLAPSVVRARVEDHSHLTPEELIETELVHGPLKQPVRHYDEKAPWDKLPPRLKQLLAQADLVGVENVQEAIASVLAAEEE